MNKLSLISQGKSDYQIIYSYKASWIELFAVSELQSFIKSVTGAFLPCIQDIYISSSAKNFSYEDKYISVGNTNLVDFNDEIDFQGEDVFKLYTKGKTLFIRGTTDRGTIYGVYDFIEKNLNVKFLSYENTFIPNLTDVDFISNGYIEKPSFKYRTFNSAPIDRMVYVQLYTDFDDRFAVRKRCTSHMCDVSPEHGGTIGWCPIAGMNHTAFSYVDPNKWYDSHPEMFVISEDNKPLELCLTDGITDDGNIDETKEISTIKIALESLKQFIKNSPPDTKYYMFGQNDVDLPCCCDKCQDAVKKYGRSGITIRFCNILAREGQKWANKYAPGKEVNIVFFAYTYNEDAPLDSNDNLLDKTCIPEKNTVVMLAPIYADYYVPIGDKRQVPAVNRLFERWKKVHNRFFVWTYHRDFICHFWYFPAWKCFSNQLKYLKDFGAEYVFMQSSGNDLANPYESLNAYIAFKLLWNVNIDPLDIRNEYLYYTFGEKSFPIIKHFYDRFDENVEEQVNNHGLKFTAMGAWPHTYDRYDSKFYTLNFLNEQLSILDEAYQQILDDDMLTQNRKDFALREIQRMRLVPMYMILYNYNDYYKNQGRDCEKNKKLYAKKFFNLCDDLDVKMYKIRGYIKDLKKSFDIE